MLWGEHLPNRLFGVIIATRELPFYFGQASYKMLLLDTSRGLLHPAVIALAPDGEEK